MTNRLHGYAVSVAAATALGLAGSAHAQNASAGDTGQTVPLSEVIVTAQRVQERAQDVPISMTVLDQGQISTRGITTTSDLALAVPSMSVDNSWGDEASSFSIRGFQQALQTTPSVAVYFADAVVPHGGNVGEPTGSGVAPGTMFDLQNLEVLKGPQGTLFGDNTDGGAVLLVPRKPTSDFGGYVEGSYGNFGMNGVQAVLNIPISDSLRVRLGVNHGERDGYQDNISGVGPGRFANQDFTAVRLSVDADLTNSIENYTVASYNLSINNGTLPQLFACNSNPATVGPTLCAPQLAYQQSQGPYAVANQMPDPESYLKQYQVVNSTTWNASDYLTVKNIANYGELITVYDSSLFGAFTLPSPYGNIQLFSSNSDPSALGPNGDSTDQYTWSDELQLRGTLNQFTWQGGGYIEGSGPLGEPTGSQSANFLSCTDVATFSCSGAGLVDRNLSRVHFTDHAVYGQGTYTLTPQLKLTGGMRYTWDTTTATIHQTDYAYSPLLPNMPALTFCASPLLPPSALATGCTQNFTQDSSAPTWLLDLDYTPTQNLLVFAKYARGYRQGSVATFVNDPYHLYGPEHVNDYEVGEKLTFPGVVPGSFDVTAFYDDFTDEQLLAGFNPTSTSGGQPESGIVNAGKSRIWGLEVESTVEPVHHLFFSLSYAYLNTDLLSETIGAPPAGYVVEYPAVPGGPLPFSPKSKVSAAVNYQLPLPDNVGQVALGADYTYTSAMLTNATAAPYDFVPSYGLLGANLNWEHVMGSRFDVEFFGTNLANKVYYNNLTQLYNAVFGIAAVYLGEPRMYGVRVRVNF